MRLRLGAMAALIGLVCLLAGDATGTPIGIPPASQGGPPAGTSGQLQFNNGGVPGAISEGTAGQVLTSQGAGLPPAFGDAAAPGADSVGTSALDDGTDTPGSGDFLRVDTVDQAGIEYLTPAEARTALGADDASNLAAGTIPAGRVGSSHIASLPQIDASLRSGLDSNLITGTPTASQCAEFNADGDIVGSGAACPAATFVTVDVPTGTDPVAGSVGDTFAVTCGSGLACNGPGSNTLDISLTNAQTWFKTIDVQSGVDPVATSANQTLRFQNSTGIGWIGLSGTPALAAVLDDDLITVSTAGLTGGTGPIVRQSDDSNCDGNVCDGSQITDVAATSIDQDRDGTAEMSCNGATCGVDADDDTVLDFSVSGSGLVAPNLDYDFSSGTLTLGGPSQPGTLVTACDPSTQDCEQTYKIDSAFSGATPGADEQTCQWRDDGYWCKRSDDVAFRATGDSTSIGHFHDAASLIACVEATKDTLSETNPTRVCLGDPGAIITTAASLDSTCNDPVCYGIEAGFDFDPTTNGDAYEGGPALVIDCRGAVFKRDSAAFAQTEPYTYLRLFADGTHSIEKDNLLEVRNCRIRGTLVNTNESALEIDWDSGTGSNAARVVLENNVFGIGTGMTTSDRNAVTIKESNVVVHGTMIGNWFEASDVGGVGQFLADGAYAASGAKSRYRFFANQWQANSGQCVGWGTPNTVPPVVRAAGNELKACSGAELYLNNLTEISQVVVEKVADIGDADIWTQRAKGYDVTATGIDCRGLDGVGASVQVNMYVGDDPKALTTQIGTTLTCDDDGDSVSGLDVDVDRDKWISVDVVDASPTGGIRDVVFRIMGYPR